MCQEGGGGGWGRTKRISSLTSPPPFPRLPPPTLSFRPPKKRAATTAGRRSRASLSLSLSLSDARPPPDEKATAALKSRTLLRLPRAPVGIARHLGPQRREDLLDAHVPIPIPRRRDLGIQDLAGILVHARHVHAGYESHPGWYGGVGFGDGDPELVEAGIVLRLRPPPRRCRPRPRPPRARPVGRNTPGPNVEVHDFRIFFFFFSYLRGAMRFRGVGGCASSSSSSS